MNFSKKTSVPRKSPLLLAAASISGALALGAASQAQGPAKKISYDNFQKVQTRNIFDPDRNRDLVKTGTLGPRPHPVYSNTPSPAPVAHVNTDYVQLTGIMMTEDETFAFFAGTLPEYNKVVPVNGTIAGATITKITSSSIDVARDGKPATINVGQTVPLDANSQPGVPPSSSAAAVAPPVESAPAPAAVQPAPGGDPQSVSAQVPLPDGAGGTAPPSSPPPADNVSDAMKRMMERRAKELNQ